MILPLVAMILIATSAITYAKKPNTLYDQAMRALQAGDFEEAIHLAQKLKQLFPEDKTATEALFILGRAFEERDPMLALETYRAYLNHQPFSVHKQEAKFKVAIIQNAVRQNGLIEVPSFLKILRLRNLGQYDKAIENCNIFMDAFPESHLADDALHLIAYIQLIDQADYAEAISAYEAFIERFPMSPYFDNALFGQALAHEGMGQFDVARGLYSAIRDRHTQNKRLFGRWLTPKDSYLSRLWFSKAANRLSKMSEREISLRNAPQLDASQPVTIGMGNGLKMDWPPGSGQSYRSLWHLTKENGFQLTHLTHWITRQTDWRWESKHKYMACIRAGYTPVISFWYFGDEISPEFVEAHKTLYWQTIQNHLIPLIRDLPEVVILLEPEFNKNGIPEWRGWDEVASHAISLIKKEAPGARVGITFGDWDDYEYKDPTVHIKNAAQKSDFIGFIEMTSSFDYQVTFDPSWSFSERIGRFAQHLKKSYNKPLYLGYVAISTANNWEEKQARFIEQFFDFLPYYTELGLSGAAFFSLYDNPAQQGWFSGAERHFGLFAADGHPKPGANAWRARTAQWRQGDRTPPRWKTPLSGLPDAPIDFSHPQAIAVEGELSEWCRWRVEIAGQKSGAVWRAYGAGSRVFFQWDGWADEGAFNQEPCQVFIYATDASGNALNPALAHPIDIARPMQIASVQIPVRDVQIWGREARLEPAAHPHIHLPSAPSGARITWPPQNADIGDIRARSCLKVTLSLSGSDGLLIGLETASGFRSEHMIEAYTHPVSNAPQTLRIPLSDFSDLGIRYDARGEPERQPFDFQHISGIVFTATASPISFQLHHIAIETTLF